jgi:uncharacterized protein (TIGR00730 family)
VDEQRAAQGESGARERVVEGRRRRRVAVFCASGGVEGSPLVEAARRFGQLLARSGGELVYGGARVGLMGAVADGCLAEGGRVVGVIPRGLVVREVAHTGLSELLVVESMHERKQLMHARADAFVALPGGFGTLDELFETLTWGQIGMHRKPVGLLSVDGFWEPLVGFLDGVVARGLLRPDHRALLRVEADPQALLDHLERFEAPALEEWVGPRPLP